MIPERCQMASDVIRKESDGVRKVSDGETWAMSFARSARKKTPQTSSSCPSTRACFPRLRSPHMAASSLPVRPEAVAQADWRAGDWRRAGDVRWLTLASYA